MIVKNIVIKNRYLDSVVLMEVAAKVRTLDGVREVSAMMGTDANRELIRGAGLLDGDGAAAGPSDLLVAVKATNEGIVTRALAEIERLLDRRETADEAGAAAAPRSLAAALDHAPGLNLAFFSLPGPYVKREAMAALDRGLNLMIFSDNVTVAEEVALKRHAEQLGLLVMGPDCGTAIINGKALGFANVCARGPIGIVGASGTGIQQVSVILANRGYGISQAIGLGGRDLKPEVGGIMMKMGIKALAEDPDTELIVLISKPPAPEVAKSVLDLAKRCRKKVVVNFLKGDPEEAARRNLPFADSLEAAAELAIATLENRPAPHKEFDHPDQVKRQLAEIRPKLGGKFLRGLYSGGTLADETLLVLARLGIEVKSNLPLKPELALKDNHRSEQHTIVDLGEDEFTRGRPHPMIDFTLRNDRLAQEAADPETRVILLDIVTGYGSNPDPAGAIIPAIAAAKKKVGERIAFVAAVCGTELDPQPLGEQTRKLTAAGVTVLPTNAQAARFAARLLG